MQQLRLVTATTPHTTHHAARDVAQEVFEHWAFFHREGKPVAQRVSVERREVVRRAVDDFGFDVEVLMLAVEGCKASRFCQGENRTRMRLDDLGWILASERRIEQLAEFGVKARADFEAAQAQPVEVHLGAAPTEQQRQRLADMRRFLASKR